MCYKNYINIATSLSHCVQYTKFIVEVQLGVNSYTYVIYVSIFSFTANCRNCIYSQIVLAAMHATYLYIIGIYIMAYPRAYHLACMADC